MNHGAVAHMRTFFQEDGFARKHVDDTPLLDIAAALKHNLSPISSKHSVGTNVAVRSDGDVPNQCGLGMHKRRWVHHGGHSFECKHHGVQRVVFSMTAA